MRIYTRILMLFVALATFAPMLLAAGDVESPQSPENGGNGVLHFSANLMFWEYVSFGLILLIVGWKVLPVMLKQLGERQNRIKDALDKADQVRSEAEVLLRKHEEMMRNAHADAKKITDEAVAAARQAAAKIQADAEAAAQESRARAEKEVEQLMRKAQAELREQAVELALLASSRVLEKSVAEEDHRRLAREAIEATATMNN